MSVRDLNKVFIISDALNGDIITSIDYDMYRAETLENMIRDLFHDFCLVNEHGILIKVGSKR